MNHPSHPSYTEWLDKADPNYWENWQACAKAIYTVMGNTEIPIQNIVYFPTVNELPEDKLYLELHEEICSACNGLLAANPDAHPVFDNQLAFIAAWVRNKMHPSDLQLDVLDNELRADIVAKSPEKQIPTLNEDTMPGGQYWQTCESQINFHVRLVEVFTGTEIGAIYDTEREKVSTQIDISRTAIQDGINTVANIAVSQNGIVFVAEEMEKQGRLENPFTRKEVGDWYIDNLLNQPITDTSSD